ncbi:MAG: N-succinylarginine dihydrolase [Oceanipulchritudo sp.]
MKYHEINFDGLVGPTHNYAGLSSGNIASVSHRGDISNPRAAALQGLAKAKALADRGYPQALLPPHERPSIPALRQWGFDGKRDEEVLAAAARLAPDLLAAASSASAMWAANACTMTPSLDSGDGLVHFTPANLHSKLHRSLEPRFTQSILRAVFADEDRFRVHDPLPGGEAMADEGAANHTRLTSGPAGPGLHLFVYGRGALGNLPDRPRRFPARQSRESSEALARRHRIAARQCLFIQQAPEAIDAGVFHNDVIAVGSQQVLLLHETAFLDQKRTLEEIRKAFSALGGELRVIEVPAGRVSLKEAVDTYLFNSQLLPLPGGGMLLVVPAECAGSQAVSELLEDYVSDDSNPIREVLAFDLRESMRNGGGPACLRQRVVLNTNETRHLRGRIFLDEALNKDLETWVKNHYRDHLSPADLADPRLLEESRLALDELTGILHLPALYPFQK